MKKIQEEVVYYQVGDAFQHTPTRKVEIIVDSSDGLFLLSPDNLSMTKLYRAGKISAADLEHYGGIFDAEFKYLGAKKLQLED